MQIYSFKCKNNPKKQVFNLKIRIYQLFFVFAIIYIIVSAQKKKQKTVNN